MTRARRSVLPVLPVALLLGVTPATASAQRHVATNLITHNEVEIDRPSTDVWPHILDPLDWKQGQRLRHMAGEAGAVGELFGAFDAGSPDDIKLHLQNVELLPNRRRTIKLMEPNGTLLGFATWTLVERGGHTLVSYDVSMETPLAPDQAARTTASELATMELQANEANGARFESELQALKRLVEGS